MEQEREGVWGITTVFYTVINKRISQSFSLSHFWPLGTAYMSALTGGVSLIIRPKTKEYVCAHSYRTEYLVGGMSSYYLLSFGCLYEKLSYVVSRVTQRGVSLQKPTRTVREQIKFDVLSFSFC